MSGRKVLKKYLSNEKQDGGVAGRGEDNLKSEDHKVHHVQYVPFLESLNGLDAQISFFFKLPLLLFEAIHLPGVNWCLSVAILLPLPRDPTIKEGIKILVQKNSRSEKFPAKNTQK